MRLYDVFKREPKPLTARIAMELIGHEAIVTECYKDSVGVWTWGVGVTNASGHKVHPRYLDRPQPIGHCIGVYVWLLENRYLPDVLAAFKGHTLAEHELGAALSFHYNTGAILRASWVREVKAGDRDTARASFMNWCKPASLTERRTKERNLFFDGDWSSDGKATVYPVRKPSYSPHWSQGKRIDVEAIVQQVIGGR